MALQTGSRIVVAVHRETSIAVQATATGATQVRIVGGNGLELKRARVVSGEKLASGNRSMMRLGYKTVDGSWDSEVSVGGFTDMAAESILRAAWVTSTSVGFATLTTVAIGSNTLTAAGGSWATQGIKVGDIFYLSSTTVAGNNNVNARVVALTTLTLTTNAGAFSTLAATATGTITVLKKLTQAATPTRYSHTVEQYDQDITKSEQFTGCRLVGLKFSYKPGQMAKMTPTWLGVDRVTGTSQYFTSPSLTTSASLVADDSTIYYNGAAQAYFTGFDLDFQITAAGVPVIGSLTTPDIFDNDLQVTGSITGLRSDFSNLTLFDAETEFALSILLQEPTGAPKAAFATYLPRVKISALSAAPVGGGDGAKVETLTVEAGPKTATSFDDATIATFHSSAVVGA